MDRIDLVLSVPADLFTLDL